MARNGAVDYPARFARRLRLMREARGLTLEVVASRADMGLGALSEIENGKRWRHRFIALERLAKALGVTVNELLDA